MKKISALCIAVMAAAAPLFAQGGITPEMLSSISRGYTGTPAEKALRNALAGNSSRPMPRMRR